MISIIIPNYNGLENLRKNLPKVFEALKNFSEDGELLIVDDASVDSSVEYLKVFCEARNQNCRLIVNEKNLGFGESCNLGVQNAKGEIVVLLNSDVWPEKDFLKYLIPHFDDKQVFAVGCLEKTLDLAGQIADERGAGILYFKNGIYQHMKGDIESEKTDWVCGGSGAFRKELFLKFKGFDKLFYPFYWEDIDLSYRAKKAGYELIFEKKSVVYHQHLVGSIAKEYSEAAIEKISFNNQLKFTRKHIRSIDQIFNFIIFTFKILLKKTVGI
jgi:GT2 family glycosyltransferase